MSLAANKGIFWGIFLLILLVGLLFIVSVNNQDSKFKSAINSYLLPTSISTDERMSFYWLSVKYEPIFAIPGADLSKMTNNIDLLANQLKQVADYYYNNDKEDINNSLHPIEFLYQITELETLRHDFIEEPTKQKAERYHHLLLNTIDTYQESLQEIMLVLDRFDNKTIGFVSGTTSAALILDRLQNLELGAEEFIALENKRFDCLDSSFPPCLDLLPDNAKPDSFIESETRQVIDELTWNNKQSIDVSFAQVATSTTIVLENSLCYAHGEPAIYALWDEINSMLPGNLFKRGTPINDIFLKDLLIPGQNAYIDHLSSTGLDYDIQPMNMYLCIDGGQEYQKLATIEKINQLIKVITFPENSKQLPKELIDLQSIARLITDNPAVLYETDTKKFVSIVDSLFYSYPEKELVDHLDLETYNTLREISLLWETQSAALDVLINTTSYMTETSKEALDYIDIPLEQLYLTRSFISILFFMGNETVTTEKSSLITRLHAQELSSFNMRSANEIFPTIEDKIKLREMLIENRIKFP